ncbi:30S ribosomal protein S7 [Chitinivibrio alkaliphilus]|uniref:Small ribosomal subunit protein uS7 n=1 Tax=Chitinivibrio alkaliphilus ACht1 TaxID=1313304 RepID=U7D9D7_9BACT|nr:30S ribosomal protein S7 [Chitinivibrio alkaliphilus]ERP31020.1 30S ribosomal protein S7 [Chitinivibrio alkaliphilus ACht1]
MSRRNRAVKRPVVPDSRYGSTLVTKFMKCMMLDGKFNVARTIFYKAMDRIKGEYGKDGVTVFKKAIDNIKPALEVKTRRVGGANYQVPLEVSPVRGNALAMRWLIDAARGRNEKSMVERLSNEIWQAFNKEGAAVRKKVEVHKMAEANKAFAHFRW